MRFNKKNRLQLIEDDGVTIVCMGRLEIWDGADLALLRETLHQLIRREKCRSIGVDMQYVKYIPSGFFGMLADWNEKGVAIRLYSPQPHVREMIWFRQFFQPETADRFVLDREMSRAHSAFSQFPWQSKAVWQESRSGSEQTPTSASIETGGRR